MKTKIALVALVAAIGVAGGIAIFGKRGGNHAVEAKPAPVVKSAPVPTITSEPLVATQTAVINQPARPTQSKVTATSSVQTDTAAADQSLVINGYAVQDPMARVALSYVGSDPEADAYWFEAINNSNLPAEERKDLIEDLNEDGLANPHLATPEDRPLIANRIALIEQIAPQVMDQTDADAFAEAYKDLVNLYNGLPAN